jgi:hypothetical protein
MEDLCSGTFRRGKPFMMLDALFDMIMGMILGMIASPLMMKGIKVIRQRRKVDRILRQISQEQRTSISELKSENR